MPHLADMCNRLLAVSALSYSSVSSSSSFYEASVYPRTFDKHRLLLVLMLALKNPVGHGYKLSHHHFVAMTINPLPLPPER